MGLLLRELEIPEATLQSHVDGLTTGQVQIPE